MAALTYRRTTVARFSRSCAISVAVSLVVASLGLAACGGDDEEPATTAATTPPADTFDAEITVVRPSPTETEEERPPATNGSPEEQQGGAGDELPARSLALLTGRGGRITPVRVRVPAFISIRVELRSADGQPYALRLGRRTLRAGAELSSVSSTFAGLRPGAALVGRPIDGTGNSVRIEATAEPGP